MLINESLIGKENLRAIEQTTSNMAMGFLAPIFFAGIGLEFHFSSIQNFGLLVTVIAVSYLSKIAGGYLGGTIAGLRKRVSLTLGVGLNARGIMELVIANIAYKNDLISTEVFSILVIMGILTTLTTPILLQRAFKKSDA
jgi:Kef-type K+ transport system membrane component KefB